LQTPQGFHYETILKAHISARKLQDITDDTGVVSAYGEDVYMVPGSRLNIKITNPEDLLMATSLLGSQTQTVTRTAMGYDVHALVPGNGTIRLGGIDIPHDKKLLGHSDADVVLHAVTDALLGAISAGDIGTYFPPSDMAFKNMDSAIFLRKAAELICERNGTIVHMDITILAEKPKILPYRAAMQENIAEILSLPASSISIKATTTEGLGFTGREEGIVAQALATVRFPL
jgi:2-C-methyl-D-erythritol 4-phosphate cytidylyltransferase/2-C-methyl-D-erythritol 2,4-cyclodiphosphate synthase